MLKSNARISAVQPITARFLRTVQLLGNVCIIAGIIGRAGILPAAAEPTTFKIGAVLPLTGPTADYGKAIQNAINLAREDQPDAFNGIEFRYEDAGNDLKSAVSAYHRFKDIEKVDLIYTWGVGFCKVLSPLSEQNRFPVVGQCIDQASSRGKSYFLRFMNSNDQYAQVAADYLASQGYQRVGLVLTEHPYLEEMLSGLERTAQGRFQLSVIDRYPMGEMDFRSSISKLRRGGFDAIGAFVYAGQTAEFCKQSRVQRSSTPLFGTNLFESVSEIKAAQGAMEGGVFSSTMIKPEFIARYRARYGNDSQLAFGGPSYEFARSVAREFGHLQRRLTATEIIERFRSMKSDAGVAAGPYSFENTPEAGMFVRFPLTMKQVRGEGFEVLAPGQ